MNIRDQIEKVLETHFQGIRCDDTNKYHCWKITRYFPKSVYSTWPTVELLYQKEEAQESFIWLGPKGAILTNVVKHQRNIKLEIIIRNLILHLK